MTVLGYLVLAAGVALSVLAVTSVGPFIGALLGPVLIVIGGVLLEERRVRQARRRGDRRRPGYVHPRL